MVNSNFYSTLWAPVTVTETKPGEPPVETTGHVFVPTNIATTTHDLDGNLIADRRWSYTWDAENRLIRMETSTSNSSANLPRERIDFRYDAFWRRTEKVVWKKNAQNIYEQQSQTRFACDGWNLIAEWENDALARTHHWGLDLSDTLQGAGGVGGLVLTRHHDAQGVIQSYVPAYDGTGNVMALLRLTDATPVAEYEYGPFGEPPRHRSPGPHQPLPVLHQIQRSGNRPGLLRLPLLLADNWAMARQRPHRRNGRRKSHGIQLE